MFSRILSVGNLSLNVLRLYSSCHTILAIVTTSVTINGYKTASKQLLPAQGHSTSVTGTL